MPTAERVAEVTRLFAPLIIGAVLVIAGLMVPNFGLVALGAGALGIPGAVMK